MFGEGKSNKSPMKFVVAYRIDDDTTKKLMNRCIETGYQPEQVARYALKKYLSEINHVER